MRTNAVADVVVNGYVILNPPIGMWFSLNANNSALVCDTVYSSPGLTGIKSDVDRVIDVISSPVEARATPWVTDSLSNRFWLVLAKFVLSGVIAPSKIGRASCRERG